MGHSHSHSHSHAHAHVHAPGGRLAAALALTSTILVAELVGAWWSGSLALLSDAAHMATDAAALAIALLADRAGRRPADERRTFGYRRLEVLAAALNALLLIAAAAFVTWEAWRRLDQPAEIASGVMLWVAGIGLVANLLGMRLLAAGQATNMNVRGAYLEVWSDMLGSLGVIAGALAIQVTGRDWIDSVVAIAIGLWVLPRTVALLRGSVHVLLEGVPEGIELAEVRQALSAIPGVRDVHDLHVWTIGSGQSSLTAHLLLVPQEPGGDGFLARAGEAMVRRFGIHHCTFQLEHRPCAQAGAPHRFGPAPDAHDPHPS